VDPETTEAEEAFEDAFDNVVVLEPSSEPEYDWDPSESDIA
jgi:hypothetical protein